MWNKLSPNGKDKMGRFGIRNFDLAQFLKSSMERKKGKDLLGLTIIGLILLTVFVVI